MKFEPGHLPVYLVKLDVFERTTGYSSDATQKKIQRGEWVEGKHWHRGPDGHILMDLRGYHEWGAGQKAA